MPSLFTRIEDGKPVSPEHVRALQAQVQALSRSFGGIPGYVDSTGYHPRRQTSKSLLGSISITIDGGGNVISSTNPTLGGATVEVPANCTITNWTVEADASGSIAVDVTRANKAVPSTSIVGAGNKPTLATAQYATAAPASWTSVDLVEGDIIGFAISGTPATVKRVTVTLRVK